jgi:integrase
MKHKRERYQHGSLTTEKRSNGQKVWVYRWRESRQNGESVHRKRVVGTKAEYPTKSAALKAVDGLRLEVNIEAVTNATPVSVDQIIAHYKETELADTNRKTTRTKQVYEHQLDTVISPKWGSYRLKDVSLLRWRTG